MVEQQKIQHDERGLEEERPIYFTRVVRHYGFSRALALGPVLPADWILVKIEEKKRGKDYFTIKITRLK